MTLGHARNTAIPVTSFRTGFRALSVNSILHRYTSSISRLQRKNTSQQLLLNNINDFKLTCARSGYGAAAYLLEFRRRPLLTSISETSNLEQETRELQLKRQGCTGYVRLFFGGIKM